MDQLQLREQHRLGFIHLSEPQATLVAMLNMVTCVLHPAGHFCGVFVDVGAYEVAAADFIGFLHAAAPECIDVHSERQPGFWNSPGLVGTRDARVHIVQAVFFHWALLESLPFACLELHQALARGIFYLGAEYVVIVGEKRFDRLFSREGNRRPFGSHLVAQLDRLPGLLGQGVKPAGTGEGVQVVFFIQRQAFDIAFQPGNV
ncbi:hypothetical protein ALQ16_202569 [Pseudomonas syringae pv. actinidiae]|nr:hypothetical protein ALQ16_202569 [Pseudomonas syringae pv. actinidiae]RMS14749.1 hypothetical protein ALP75_203264 [Pseudomonas syringae pv. actinidiae]RMS58928.1 hypothetical protein ALP64_205061 [Pseudomonas syringae pv. actinidiae]